MSSPFGFAQGKLRRDICLNWILTTQTVTKVKPVRITLSN